MSGQRALRASSRHVGDDAVEIGGGASTAMIMGGTGVPPGPRRSALGPKYNRFDAWYGS